MSTPEMVMIDRDNVKQLLTCPLCNETYRDATSVIDCLHTFCRNCICNKIMEEDLDHCPVCNYDLGCHPLERLRSDMNWKHIRETIFPEQVRVEPPIPLPPRRKERSLSSLGFNTIGSSRQTRVATRRSRSNARNNPSLQSQNASVHESNLENANEKRALVETQHLSQNLPTIPEEVRPPVDDFRNRFNLNEVAEDVGGSSTQEAELWKPLSSLADAAIEARSGKSMMEEDAVKLVDELPKLRSIGMGNRNKPHVAHKETAPEMSELVEPRRLRSSRRRAATATENTNVAAIAQGAAMATENRNAVAQAQKTAATTQETNVPTAQAQRSTAATEKSTHVAAHAERAAAATENTNISAQAQAQAQTVVAVSVTPAKLGPIWFSLTACSDYRQGFSLLPQIPSKYIKVSQRNLPVSYIQKYLAKKLDLASDTEVQVFLGEAPIPPTLLLENLLDFWLKTTPKPETLRASAGSSGEDFVMPLSYARIRTF